MSPENNSETKQKSNQSTTSNLKKNLEAHLNFKTFWMMFIPLLAGSLMLVLVVIGFWFIIDFRKPISSITITGSSKSKVIPDKASVNLYAELYTSNQEEANTKLDTIEKETKAYLIGEGIPEEKIVINRSFEKNYRYGYPIESEVESANEEFVARLTFDITFEEIQDDTAKPRRIVDQMMKLGVTYANSFSYQVDNEDEVCKELEIKATEDAFARSKDQISALGGGRIIKKSVKESYGCGQNFAYPLYGGRAEVSITSDATTPTIPTTLNPGETEYEATVILEVEYK